MVVHNKQASNFVLWDRECVELIGESAEELNKLKIEDGGDDKLNLFPKALDNLLGYTLAFKVRVQPRFNNSSVQKISNDPQLL